jgi:hypothetical protein
MRQCTPTIAVSAAFSMFLLISFFYYAGTGSSSQSYTSLRSGTSMFSPGHGKDDVTHVSGMEAPMGLENETKGSIMRPALLGHDSDHEAVLSGAAIMPKLGNETAKEELGRASWKFLHTLLCRFPNSPSNDEREALKSFVYLFARLYPWYDTLFSFSSDH